MKYAVILVLMGVVVGSSWAEPVVVDTIPIDIVWPGHPVGFCLLTHKGRQFVAYYNAERDMIVASRTLDSSDWTKTTLPEKVAWDSHNSITMTVDSEDFLHLSGNMHVDALVYFRSAEPLDATTFGRIEHMVGTEEDRVTYPDFFTGPTGELIFTYRDGSSGSGNQIYNVYDTHTKSWRRMLDTPLTDGRGEMNAYFRGPLPGPDDYYHLAWVWRDTPDCATNHHVSYARSRDLIHWERGDGTPVALPMTIDTAGVVDPVPPGGGAINGNVAIGFDAHDRTIVSYHKYDENGHTQIYNARIEDGAWAIYQTSDWDTRWEFSGGGSIQFDVRVSPVSVDAEHGLVQPFSNNNEGSGRWVLDPATLKPSATLAPERAFPPGLSRVESEFPGMRVHLRGGTGAGPDGRRYALRWETLGSNRDKPRDPPWPEPSELRLIVIEDK